MKLVFTYNLLCDECNWEFIGFGIPGTVAKKTRKRKKTNNFVEGESEKVENDENLISEILASSRTIERVPAPNNGKKKVQKPELEQPSLFENKNEPKVNNENSETDEFNLKKRKVKKKVRVKFY